MNNLPSELHMSGIDLSSISINFITQHMTASYLQLDRIHKATFKDDALLRLKHVILNGSPTKVNALDPEL